LAAPGHLNRLASASLLQPSAHSLGANKEAAGEPAANSTGRHHNVREDIDLAGCRTAREASIDITTKHRHI
jgi:hypothetical protein